MPRRAPDYALAGGALVALGGPAAGL